MGTFEARKSGSIDAMSSLLILCSSLANWLSVRLRTKWLWVRIALLSLRYRQKNMINHSVSAIDISR